MRGSLVLQIDFASGTGKWKSFFQTAGVPLVARTINTRQSSTSRSPVYRPKTTPIEWKVEGRRRELGPKEGTHPIQTATASRHNAQLCETSVIMPRRPTKLNLPGACPSSKTRVSRCRVPRPTQAWKAVTHSLGILARSRGCASIALQSSDSVLAFRPYQGRTPPALRKKTSG